MKLGYMINQDGKWYYSGESEVEPKEKDVVSKSRMVTSRNSSKSSMPISTSNELSMHQSLMSLELTEEVVRTTISIPNEYLVGMKGLASKMRLRLSDLYTLAIAEFIEKYDHDLIEEMKKGQVD